MIAEVLEALAEAASAISVWPDREERRWRWVYWTFITVFVLGLFVLIAVAVTIW